MKALVIAALTLLGARAESDTKPSVATAWPEPKIPAVAAQTEIGDALQINGVPTRIIQFASRGAAQQIIDAFTDSLDRHDGAVAAVRTDATNFSMGGRRGDYWLTLRVRATDAGTVGTWSAAPVFGLDARAAARVPEDFPAGARIVQQLDSIDAGRRSQLVIGLHAAAIDAVANDVEANMYRAGFRKSALVGKSRIDTDRYVAIFERPREEVLVSLQREPAGTSVTFNRLTPLEVTP